MENHELMNHESDSSDTNSTYRTEVYCGILQFPDLKCHPDSKEIEKRLLAIENPRDVNTLWLCQNRLTTVPANINRFVNMNYLCVSYCGVTSLPDFSEECPLTRLAAKCNNLTNDVLAKNFQNLTNLWQLDLSENRLTKFPEEILYLSNLRFLFLDNNSISEIPKDIWKLKKLRILSMEGNKLTKVPSTLGQLKELQVLDLSNNMLECLPSWIANLTDLMDLILYNNRLRTLPFEITTLNCLKRLYVQNNPLVVRFIPNMIHDPSSLLELAARTIKTNDVRYDQIVPHNLVQYVNSADRCAYPYCKGVFLDNRMEYIKFVDFCGNHRLPLLQYVCSRECCICMIYT